MRLISLDISRPILLEGISIYIKKSVPWIQGICGIVIREKNSFYLGPYYCSILKYMK